jgi:hypothetical protein
VPCPCFEDTVERKPCNVEDIHDTAHCYSLDVDETRLYASGSEAARSFYYRWKCWQHPARITLVSMGVVADTVRVACGTHDDAEELRERFLNARIHQSTVKLVKSNKGE